jgi:hypothetical protein
MYQSVLKRGLKHEKGGKSLNVMMGIIKHQHAILLGKIVEKFFPLHILITGRHQRKHPVFICLGK